MTVLHIDPTLATAFVTDLHPPVIYGSGRKIPMRYRIRYGNRWHRVYCMILGNGGSIYIVHGKRELFLDIQTEYALQDGLMPEHMKGES